MRRLSTIPTNYLPMKARIYRSIAAALLIFALQGVMALPTFGSTYYQSDPMARIDSLQGVLEEAITAADSVETYHKIAYALSGQDPERALVYTDSAWAMANLIQDGKSITKTAWAYKVVYAALKQQDQQLYWLKEMFRLGEQHEMPRPRLNASMGLGLYFKKARNYDSALHYYTFALALSKQINQPKDETVINGNLANVYKRLGKLDLAEAGYLRAIALADSLGKLDSKGINLMNLGNIYSFQGKVLASIACMDQALTIADQINHRKLKVYTLSNLGSLYTTLENYPKAKEYLKQGLEVALQLNDPRRIFTNLRELGRISNKMEDFEQAQEYWEEALALAISLEDPFLRGNILVRLGGVYFELEKPEASQEAYATALELLQPNGDPQDLIAAYIGVAYYSEEAGDYAQALEYVHASLKIAQETGIVTALRNTTEVLHKLYAQHGNYELAYQYSVDFKTYSDSLINADQIREMTNLENSFAFEKERETIAAENALMEANLQAQILTQRNLRNLGWAGAILLGISALFFWANYRNKRRAHREQVNQNRVIQNLSQFKEAMTGMIAHDLKNPLSVILNKAKAPSAIHRMAQQMLQLTSNMLDVHKMETAEVELKPEALPLRPMVLRATEQVQPLVEEKNLRVALELPAEAVVLADQPLLYRVLINLLTNAIKFSPQNAAIRVNATATADGYQVSVSDAGVGIPEEQLAHIFDAFGQAEVRSSGGIGSTGLGLTFCKLALAAHGSDIHVTSSVGEGTTFSFRLPVGEASAVVPVVAAVPQDAGMRIAKEDWKALQALLPELKALAVYEAVAIESLLNRLQAEGQAETRQWVDSVLNAAYTGNQTHYDAILSDVGEVLP
ncbi:MAG: tetratricopeptide repeat-containing sensor histidine kinase [Bacteroidota bacterium]